MTVVRRPIKGELRWVIDRSFRAADGTVERYRRCAVVQNRQAAEAEERRIIDLWTKHGSLKPALELPSTSAPPAPRPPAEPTWKDAVAHFRRVVLPTKKPSTRKGYEALLKGPGMRRWSATKLSEVTRAEINAWDMTLCQTGMSASTRRNHHVLLRSVLVSVGPMDGEAGLLLAALPTFPRLPKVGQKAVQAVNRDDVEALLGEVDDVDAQPVWAARRSSARLAFALGIVAGLRASEIRGLRVEDIDLRRGVLTVRRARVGGEEAPPKSGHDRQVPIGPRLKPFLERACAGKAPGSYVATTYKGTPWADAGIWAALQRATKRLGLPRSRVHGLRHFFATRLFEERVDARTVQALLGHHSLEVTQRYAATDADRARAAVAGLL